jgi:hypothetical protein
MPIVQLALSKQVVGMNLASGKVEFKAGKLHGG